MAICPAKWNHLCNIGREHYGEHSCEIILNSVKWFRRRCCIKKMFILNGKGHYGDHSKLGQVAQGENVV